VKAARISGWKISAREAVWRCCATESAIRCRAARCVVGREVGWVVRGGMVVEVEVGAGTVVVVVVEVVDVVASGEEEEALVGWEGGVEAAEAEEEDMSVLGEWEGKKGSVVSVRCRFARREVKNAGCVLVDSERGGGGVGEGWRRCARVG